MSIDREIEKRKRDLGRIWRDARERLRRELGIEGRQEAEALASEALHLRAMVEWEKSSLSLRAKRPLSADELRSLWRWVWSEDYLKTAMRIQQWRARGRVRVQK